MNSLSGPVPGVVAGRVGKRKPQAVGYSAFSPEGPYFNSDLGVFVGGNFWDGREPDNAHQGLMPLLDPNEMNNTPTGPFPPTTGGFSDLVVQKLAKRPYSRLFARVFGPDVFTTNSDQQLYGLAIMMIAAYEASPEVVPFSSKYDYSKYGIPNVRRYVLTASEERGRALFFDRAQCFQCHTSTNLPDVIDATGGKETFTMYCFANIGVPKNVLNPYYEETNRTTDPAGFNPLGYDFVDYGLGMNPNLGTDGTAFMDSVPGDIEQFRGLFKAPSLRNVDMRPNPTFVKSYMHNGVFKSLAQVVHFYNKRNIVVNTKGEEIAFDLRDGPPDGYEALFDSPEVLDNVQNVAGVTPDNAGHDVSDNGQVGNLQLSAQDETDLVNFLTTLTDGYVPPNRTHR